MGIAALLNRGSALQEYARLENGPRRDRLWEERIQPGVRAAVERQVRKEVARSGGRATFEVDELATEVSHDIRLWVTRARPERLESLDGLAKRFVEARVADALRRRYPMIQVLQNGLDFVLRKPPAGCPLRLAVIHGRRAAVLESWREPWPRPNAQALALLDSDLEGFLRSCGIAPQAGPFDRKRLETLHRTQVVEAALAFVRGPVPLNDLVRVYALCRGIDIYPPPPPPPPGRLRGFLEVVGNLLPNLPEERCTCLLLDTNLGGGYGLAGALAETQGEDDLYDRFPSLALSLKRRWRDLPLPAEEISAETGLPLASVKQHVALGMLAMREALERVAT